MAGENSLAPTSSESWITCRRLGRRPRLDRRGKDTQRLSDAHSDKPTQLRRKLARCVALEGHMVRSSLQSWIEPGAAAEGEDGRTGLIAGACVARAASDGAVLDAVLGDGPDFILGDGSFFMAGIMDAALGGGRDFMDCVSTRLLSCLWRGLKRVSCGLTSGGG